MLALSNLRLAEEAAMTFPLPIKVTRNVNHRRISKAKGSFFTNVGRGYAC